MFISFKHSLTILIIGAASLYSCNNQGKKTPPPPEVSVINVIQKDVPIYREFIGHVFGLLDIPIRARVEGYLEGIHFKEGFRVKKGQLLYTIDAQPYEAEVAARQSEVAEAKTRYVNAANELARYKPLAEINAVSQSDLDAVQAEKDAAEAYVQAAEANLRLAKIKLSYTRIKSPVDGYIGKTEAHVGEFVGREPNPVILNTVSKLSKVRIQFFLTEKEYLGVIRDRGTTEWLAGKLKFESEEGHIELILADGSVYPHKGKIDFINRNINASTGSMLVQATFPNPPPNVLRPGMYARIKIETRVAKNALLVPQQCVTELQGQFLVYVVDKNNTIQAKPVKTGDKVGELWLIEKGLNPDDKVVFEGMQRMASGMSVTPIPVEYNSNTKEQ